MKDFLANQDSNLQNALQHRKRMNKLEVTTRLWESVDDSDLAKRQIERKIRPGKNRSTLSFIGLD